MRRFFLSPYFIAGCVLRLPFLFCLGSSFLIDLFIPFLDFAAQNVGQNPYSYFDPHFFPYGTVLLSVLAIPRAIAFHIFGPQVLGAGPIGIFLVKFPLFILEILLLVGLVQLSEKQDRHKLLLYFWLNPILIFITYIHGQLDVAAMLFLFWSVYFLITSRVALSAVFLAAGVLCKFHLVICLPLFVFYLWTISFRWKAIKEISLWLLAFLGIVFVGFEPLLKAGQFSKASLASPELYRLLAGYIDLGGQKFFLGFFLVALVIGRLVLSTRISKQGFILAVGVVLGTLLLATNPRPGWFYWIIPSLAIFYSAYSNASRLLFGVLIVTYFLYCGIPDVFPNLPELYLSLALTSVHTALFGALISLWILALRFEVPIESRSRPLSIGVAGDSGAGKNYLTNALVRVLGANDSLVIEGDDYHRWERGDESWTRYTHLNPRANHLLSMAKHTELIRRGRWIVKSSYDHSTGRFSEPQEFRPTRALFVQGLHTFYLRSMRREFDVRIYLAPNPLVKLAWKIDRDSRERGHSPDQILRSILAREKDAKSHIDPQREFADWIIEYLPEEKLEAEDVLAKLTPKVYVRHILWNDFQVGPIVERLSLHPLCEVDVDFVENDLNRISFTFRGKISGSEIKKIAWDIYSPLRACTRATAEPEFSDDAVGVSQLIFIGLLAALNQSSGGDRLV